jgi:hypothetical protein
MPAFAKCLFRSPTTSKRSPEAPDRRHTPSYRRQGSIAAVTKLRSLNRLDDYPRQN